MDFTKQQIVGAILVVISVFLFYWLSIRPEQVKKRCYADAIKSIEQIKMKFPDMGGKKQIELVTIANNICLKKKGF